MRKDKNIISKNDSFIPSFNVQNNYKNNIYEFKKDIINTNLNNIKERCERPKTSEHYSRQRNNTNKYDNN